MDSDLPAEPNDFAAATYADLAWQARLRAEDMKNPALDAEARHLESLAYAYAERYELTHGRKP
jgi:hypothetical protein